MAKTTIENTIENTALRLKAVLEVLAAEDPAAQRRISRGEVLAAAMTRVPLEGRESETLASGAARGERALSNATTKLVKAGWITKEGRAGWSITPAGRQALEDFPETADLLGAMDGTAPPVANTSAAAAEAVVEEALEAAVVVPEIPQEQHGARAHEDGEQPGPTFPQPDAVVVAGTLGKALGGADWDPAGSELQLIFDRSDELWKLTAELPAGHYEFKVALNGSWDENYGRDGHRDGANLDVVHDGGPLTFLYDHATHLVIPKQDVNS
ncbi:winged helix-turn-helix domain-containing protein [Arthrobacter sp. zg-Y820]|uniref:pullulanase X25 domain-containing protein n=1 Tax=unclassified Arthrobacter TaxID=235627 RepID=UPI001E48390A|nr:MULTISPECIES: winged helix-turn-helix domain-containing protein [unclassified Arthrobacter]MCC9196364.1 glycosidase [Arthrobacter sp. zg-Y820]MDK1279225.1 winged helix-turn-helix domain-containing protein [Arthrobacter sp. zg.Y820]MDK1359158.1 winged helix-turn-helix domain-containing protein [Arthrobacter sp. zg-Y1219]WIB08377.1 winged helix-turn-helix domain-containing protein [Arthrobacter sp. zg-Y820]